MLHIICTNASSCGAHIEASNPQYTNNNQSKIVCHFALGPPTTSHSPSEKSWRNIHSASTSAHSPRPIRTTLTYSHVYPNSSHFRPQYDLYDKEGYVSLLRAAPFSSWLAPTSSLSSTTGMRSKNKGSSASKYMHMHIARIHLATHDRNLKRLG